MIVQPIVGVADYKNGAKNNWRRWQWNEIARRVANRRNVLVLYLASDQDLDRRVAVSKGFNPNNLIAVDVDRAKVESLRAAGKLAICGDLGSVLSSWSTNAPVGVLVADLCCGWNESVDFLLSSITEGFVPFSAGSVVSINLQRGRDSYSNDSRALLSEWVEGIGKHRGKYFVSAHAFDLIASYRDAIKAACSPRGLLCDDRSLFGNLLKLADPVFNEYVGSRVTMDSAIFSFFNTTTPFYLDRKSHDGATGRAFAHYKGSPAMRAQVSAVLATRTQRINGDLPRCPDF